MQRINIGNVYEEDIIPYHIQCVFKEAQKQYKNGMSHLSIDIPNETIYINIDSKVTLYEYMERPVLLIPCVYKGVKLRPIRADLVEFD